MFLWVETEFKNTKQRPDKDEKKLVLLGSDIYILTVFSTMMNMRHMKMIYRKLILMSFMSFIWRHLNFMILARD